MLKLGSKLLNFRFSNPSSAGFTLIEVVVAIAILASLAGGAYIALNPGVQIDRAKDAISQQGLAEIRTALDTYYSDRNCYPGGQSVFVTAINTGGEWREGEVVYMNRAPLDGYGQPYIYVTDNSSACPQWYSLFAKLSTAPDGNACSLDQQSSCVPVGFDNTWACSTAGITNCAYLSGTQVSGNQIVYPTASPAPSGTITPTPTSHDFTISQPYGQFPRFYIGKISTINPSQNEEIDLTISSDGAANPNPVTSVVVSVRTDNQTNTYPMFLSSGTPTEGGWSTSWMQIDSANHTFIITFTFRDSVGNESSVDIAIR